MSITVYNKEDIVYDTTVTLVTLKCCSCGVPYAMPKLLNDHLRESRDTFYCPNGHSQVYRKSTADILKEDLEKIQLEKQAQERRLNARISDALQQANTWRDQWQKQIDEKKKLSGKLKRTEKRIANGICPCCNRTFADLANHMKSKHPELLKK